MIPAKPSRARQQSRRQTGPDRSSGCSGYWEFGLPLSDTRSSVVVACGTPKLCARWLCGEMNARQVQRRGAEMRWSLRPQQLVSDSVHVATRAQLCYETNPSNLFPHMCWLPLADFINSNQNHSNVQNPRCESIVPCMWRLLTSSFLHLNWSRPPPSHPPLISFVTLFCRLSSLPYPGSMEAFSQS